MSIYVLAVRYGGVSTVFGFLLPCPVRSEPSQSVAKLTPRASFLATAVVHSLLFYQHSVQQCTSGKVITNNTPGGVVFGQEQTFTTVFFFPALTSCNLVEREQQKKKTCTPRSKKAVASTFVIFFISCN
ncbi:unnamed protein product, partial [Pylaiella littoralis]